MKSDSPAKQFLRCPTCGRGAPRSAFTRAALGVPLQALTQTFVGRGNGPNGGGVVWSRRPMRREELEHVARALATGYDALAAQLAGEMVAESPEQVLAGIDDGDECMQIGAEWIAEAEAELERRRQIVEDERQRRIFG